MLKAAYQNDEGAQALQRLISRVLTYRGDAVRPLLDFLLGLYDGGTYKPDMALLCRRIDDGAFVDVLAVMRLTRSTGQEPHTFLVDGEQIFRELQQYTNGWVAEFDK